MNDFEKLQFLLEKTAGTPQAQAVEEAANALMKDIRALTGAMPAWLLRDERPGIEVNGAREALAVLNRCGAEWEISFPEPESGRDLALYLVQLAREILFSDRPSGTDTE